MPKKLYLVRNFAEIVIEADDDLDEEDLNYIAFRCVDEQKRQYYHSESYSKNEINLIEDPLKFSKLRSDIENYFYLDDDEYVCEDKVKNYLPDFLKAFK